MGNVYFDSPMDDREEDDSLQFLRMGSKLAEGNALVYAKSKAPSSKSGKPGRLILSFNLLGIHEMLGQEVFLRTSNRLCSRIPKQLLTADEKYLSRCLELIFASASKVTPMSPSSVYMHSFDMGSALDSLYPPETSARSSVHLAKFGVDCPVAAGSGNTVISPAAWIVGSVMRSDSMMRILKNPLFVRFNDFNDNDTSCRRPGAIVDERSSPCDLMGYSSEFSTSSFRKTEKQMLTVSSNIHSSCTLGGTPSLVPSAEPMVNDQFPASSSSSSASASFDSRGVLHCTWDGGVQHFHFCVDGQNKNYAAHGGNARLSDNKSVDFVYLFYSKPKGLKNHRPLDCDSKRMLGVMRVSTSIAPCPNNSRVQEMEFVFSSLREDQSVKSPKMFRRNGKAGKLLKFTGKLKGSHLKRSGPSKVVPGNVSLEQEKDTWSRYSHIVGVNFLENHLLPTHELAAVVVKEHLLDDDGHDKRGGGGWGLNFLEKPELQDHPPSKISQCWECCQGMAVSTSVDIIVPAGIHGGPRTRNNGPSTLIERWKSGGDCDCGGWDAGCPLKVLRPWPMGEKFSLHSEERREGRILKIYEQGSEQGLPWLKMVRLDNGVYGISFQSKLTALQCFSIVVALIHYRSTPLRPKWSREFIFRARYGSLPFNPVQSSIL